MAEPDFQGRAAAGTRALQRWYRRSTGTWKSTGWWNAANALMAVIRYTRHTGDTAHAGVVRTTFGHACWLHRDFLNKFYDDCGWWGLAWVAAHDLTGEVRYLDTARTIFAHMEGGWDDTCGGGLWWNTDRRYKNAITNELFLTLAAQLHLRTGNQRAPGNQDYLTAALRTWEWFGARGLIGPAGLINDGLTAQCANNGGETWTYNQGVILGGLAALHEITGDQDYVRQGEGIADATLKGLTSPAGILTEPCESAAAGCGGDGPQFKGIFVRYLHEFTAHSDKPGYRSFLVANAESVWASARNDADQFGLRWAGPFDEADASRQSSALEVLTAAAAVSVSS